MMLRRLLGDRKGATAIEYALIAMMISVACIGGMQAIGGQSNTGWQGVWNKSKEALGY
jgi:pilus assembly protein Flp/PilA